MRIRLPKPTEVAQIFHEKARWDHNITPPFKPFFSTGVIALATILEHDLSSVEDLLYDRPKTLPKELQDNFEGDNKILQTAYGLARIALGRTRLAERMISVKPRVWVGSRTFNGGDSIGVQVYGSRLAVATQHKARELGTALNVVEADGFTVYIGEMISPRGPSNSIVHIGQSTASTLQLGGHTVLMPEIPGSASDSITNIFSAADLLDRA